MKRKTVSLSFKSRRRGDGSAYLIALIVLMVLTMIGLSLTFVTQTEMLIGANERLLQYAFYAAESGVAIVTARALVAADTSPLDQTFNVPEMELDGHDVKSLAFQQRILSTPFLPILIAPCNLCEANGGDSYRTRSNKINFAVRVRGEILGLGNRVVAQRTLSMMLAVEPKDLTVNELQGAVDADSTAGLDFGGS